MTTYLFLRKLNGLCYLVKNFKFNNISFFLLGLSFHQQIITHNNFPVVEEKHDNFYSYYLLIKEKIKKQKKFLDPTRFVKKLKLEN